MACQLKLASDAEKKGNKQTKNSFKETDPEIIIRKNT